MSLSSEAAIVITSPDSLIVTLEPPAISMLSVPEPEPPAPKKKVTKKK